MVHCHTDRVRLGDAGIEAVIPLPLQQTDQGLIQRLPDSLSPVVPFHIDGQLRTPLVGGAFVLGMGVSIAQNHALFFIDQVGEFGVKL